MVSPASRSSDSGWLADVESNGNDSANDKELAETFAHLYSENIPSSAKASSPALRKRVLIVGDGDLSFSAAYGALHPDEDILATTYDSLDDITTKYWKTWPIVEEKLASLKNVQILHHVDARHMGQDWNTTDSDDPSAKNSKQPLDERLKGTFDVCIFNFPETGTRDKGTAQLIDGFFRAARGLLHKGGRINMMLEDTSHYDGVYQHQVASRHHRFKLIARTNMDPRLAMNGYKHLQTKKGLQPGSSAIQKEKNYEFLKVESDDNTFDSQDEFFHSSGLSDDAGRLKKPTDTVKRTPGKGQGTTTHKQRRLDQLAKEYGSQKTVEVAFKNSQKLVKEGQHALAEKLLKKITEARPKNQKYWALRGKNFKSLHRDDKAKQCDDIIYDLQQGIK